MEIYKHYTHYELGKMRGQWLAEDFPEQPVGKLFTFLMNHHKEEFTKTQEYREGIKDGINEAVRTRRQQV
jgi:predicted transcriptional regulator